MGPMGEYILTRMQLNVIFQFANSVFMPGIFQRKYYIGPFCDNKLIHTC